VGINSNNVNFKIETRIPIPGTRRIKGYIIFFGKCVTVINILTNLVFHFSLRVTGTNVIPNKFNDIVE